MRIRITMIILIPSGFKCSMIIWKHIRMWLFVGAFVASTGMENLKKETFEQYHQIRQSR